MSSVTIINEENISTVNPNEIATEKVIFSGDIRRHEKVVSEVLNNTNVTEIEFNHAHLIGLNMTSRGTIPDSKSLLIESSIIDNIKITNSTCKILSKLHIRDSKIDTLNVTSANIDNLHIEKDSYIDGIDISYSVVVNALIECKTSSLEISLSSFSNLNINGLTSDFFRMKENVIFSSTFLGDIICSDFYASANRFINHEDHSGLKIDGRNIVLMSAQRITE